MPVALYQETTRLRGEVQAVVAEVEGLELWRTPCPALVDPRLEHELWLTRVVIGNLVSLNIGDADEALDDLEELTPAGIRQSYHRNNL